MTEAEWQTALHEAGHTTAALLLHLPVRLAQRWSPYPDALGYTEMPDLAADMDRGKARKLAIMLLCGPIMADQPVPSWTLSRTDSNDELLIAILADYLWLDEAGWLGLRAEAFRFTTTDEFVNLFQSVTGLFEYFPTLDERMLAAAYEIGGAT